MIDGDDMDAVIGWLGIEHDEVGALGDALHGIVSAAAQIGQHVGLDQRATAFVMVTAVGSVISAQRDQGDFEQLLYFLRQAIDKAPELRAEALARHPSKNRQKREPVH